MSKYFFTELSSNEHKMIRILSIDDNVNNLTTMEAIIKSYCDYEVLSVDNVRDAFNVLSAHRINLIVSDIQMPDIDGFEFARMLLLKKKYQHIPLIFLTANANAPHEAELAYSLGAADYLTKPINEVRLVNKIKGYLKPLEDEILLNKMRKILFDSISDVIILADKNKNIIYHNDKALLLFPNISSRKECLFFCDEAFESMQQVFPTKNNIIFEDKEIMLKDKTYIYSQVILPDNTIKIQYRDVTEAKKQEAMMSHSSRAAALGEMVGNIAHQWRQPLATVSAIMTELEFYQELGELTDEIQAEAFGRISSSISYLSNTIDDFRSFFHGDKTVAMIPLHETISLAISIVEHSFEKLGIALIVQDESMNSNVAINVNEFSQVLINILNNARDVFSDRGTNNPTVKIILGAEKENNFIKIQDNAGGIGSDIITKIFDPYFTTKHQSQGTGLGLHMSSTIIKNHFNGTLSVSNVAEGAEFLILLPISAVGDSRAI